MRQHLIKITPELPSQPCHRQVDFKKKNPLSSVWCKHCGAAQRQQQFLSTDDLEIAGKCRHCNSISRTTMAGTICLCGLLWRAQGARHLCCCPEDFQHPGMKISPRKTTLLGAPDQAGVALGYGGAGGWSPHANQQQWGMAARVVGRRW